jgi:ATP-dependent RNA helicase DeaD
MCASLLPSAPSMTDLLSLEAAPSGLDAVLRARGFERLTPIQGAVLDPELAGRDLRLSSVTGSGKTVAIGLVLAESVRTSTADDPVALIIAPTRELATQLGRELTWLYAPWKKGVLAVTGGTSVQDEQHRLSRRPAVVVGTPGRLLDHLRRGSLRLDALATLVLDEADEMLDMGFEEELDAILTFAPAERRTHLVSATFGHRVARVAARVQRDAVSIEGTPLGAANEDIDHVVTVVEPRDRESALVNVLLRHPDDKTLVFVRTRVETQELSSRLAELGFAARALSGEMTHRERTAVFEDFRSGNLRILVATDVAARGLDVADIARVVQMDLPENADVLTHRGGRTGRAGRRGENLMLIAPRSRRVVESLLDAARVEARFAAPPTPAEIADAADARLGAAIKADAAATDDTAHAGTKHDERTRALAAQLLAENDPHALVAALLNRLEHRGPCAAREIQPIRVAAPNRAAPRDRNKLNKRFVPFQVSWGARRGADARRLLALVCRRGRLGRDDVGAIRINRDSAVVEVAEPLAASFEDAVRQKDPRDPHVRFRRAV